MVLGRLSGLQQKVMADGSSLTRCFGRCVCELDGLDNREQGPGIVGVNVGIPHELNPVMLPFSMNSSSCLPLLVLGE